MPITWDAVMDRKLFLAIMEVHGITSVDITAVASKLSTEEQVCTPKAVTHRMAKFRAEIKNSSDSSPAGTTKIASPGTPRKRGSAGAGKVTSSSKKLKTPSKDKAVAPAEDGEEDDNDSLEQKLLKMDGEDGENASDD